MSDSDSSNEVFVPRKKSPRAKPIYWEIVYLLRVLVNVYAEPCQYCQTEGLKPIMSKYGRVLVTDDISVPDDLVLSLEKMKETFLDHTSSEGDIPRRGCPKCLRRCQIRPEIWDVDPESFLRIKSPYPMSPYPTFAYEDERVPFLAKVIINNKISIDKKYLLFNETERSGCFHVNTNRLGQ